MPNTLDAANGRWREILPALGVPAVFLTGKHQPCPLCGGKDRARFTDLDGKGTYICGQCGAGTGMQLIMKLHLWDFATAAKEVDKVIGNLPKGKPRLVYTRPKPATAAEMNRLWSGANVIRPDDPVGRYFAKRGIFACGPLLPLRYKPDHRYGLHVFHPAMIAKFSDAQGKPAQIHRTYLTPEGDKIASATVRKFMPGELPKGGAIRIGDPAEVMGVAEGIETALSAAQLFQMPVWATTSASMLQVWEPPLNARRITVFGDHDANYCGQMAAYALAMRLVLDAEKRGIPREVYVRIPEVTGHDWNDVLQEQYDARATH